MSLEPAILTTYEICSVISKRAEQLSSGATPLVRTLHTDHVLIAMEEWRLGLIRGFITRQMPDGSEVTLCIQDLNPPRT